jgi:hypothetical protein
MSSMIKIASSSLLALALALAACQDGSGDDPGANGELATRLTGAPVTLAIVPPSYARISAHDQAGGPVAMDPLTIEGGSIVVHVDENRALVVDDYVVNLADIVADDGELAANPRTLTDVHVSLGHAIVIDSPWSQDGTGARATVYGEVLLDWSLVDDAGQPAPLATGTWTNVEMTVYLHLEADGTVTARLASTLEGSVLSSWGIELSDFLLNLTALSQ